jgi:hypothetical protein
MFGLSAIETLQAVGAIIILVVVILPDRFPNVEWLQHFRLPTAYLTEEQRHAHARRANRFAGIEMIFAGVMIPLGAVALWVMFFREPGPIEKLLALVVFPVGLIWLGIRTIVKAR